MGIYSTNGAFVARYTYDPWGKVLSVSDANGNAITSSTHVGNINPIRYRGYYYDAETGLYYLNSRYYDPEVGRFVNADAYVQTGTGIMDKNMYAYCLDDPVNMVDDSGAKSKGIYACSDNCSFPDKMSHSIDTCRMNATHAALAAERAKSNTSTFEKVVNAVGTSLKVKGRTGFGIAIDGAIGGVGVSAGATYDIVSAEFSPAGLDVTKVGSLFLQLTFERWYIGPSFTDIMDFESDKIIESKESWIGVNDEIPLFEANIYCIYGVGFSITFDWKNFMEQLK